MNTVEEILAKEEVSGEEMCFVLSEEITFNDKKLTPEQIWNSSQTGELYYIIMLYQSVKAQKLKMRENNNESTL